MSVILCKIYYVIPVSIDMINLQMANIINIILAMSLDFDNVRCCAMKVLLADGQDILPGHKKTRVVVQTLHANADQHTQYQFLQEAAPYRSASARCSYLCHSFGRGTVFTAICLSVSKEKNSKSYRWIFCEICGLDTSWTREEFIKFWRDRVQVRGGVRVRSSTSAARMGPRAVSNWVSV